MKFEWDEAKNTGNILKHGIDFVDVQELFNNYMLIDPDDRKDYGENRWIAIGMLRDSISVVVFTKRRKNVIRIISARKANKHERKRYQDSIPD